MVGCTIIKLINYVVKGYMEKVKGKSLYIEYTFLPPSYVSKMTSKMNITR